jgi:two-component system LytT family response regulator
MNWSLIIDDSKCKQQLAAFLKQHSESVLLKKGTGATASHSGFIVVNSSSEIRLVRIADIVQCHAQRNYTQIQLNGGKKITSSKSLKLFEELLQDCGFVRIHQSHLVNLQYMDRYIKGAGGHIILKDGTSLPVAARKKEHFLKELEILKYSSV